MGLADLAFVAFEVFKPLQQIGIRRLREQHGKQRVFLRARDIDLVQSPVQLKIRSEKIRAQNCPGNAGRRLNGCDPLRRHAVPIRDGRLRDSDTARELAHSADGSNGLFQPLGAQYGPLSRIRILLIGPS